MKSALCHCVLCLCVVFLSLYPLFIIGEGDNHAVCVLPFLSCGCDGNLVVFEAGSSEFSQPVAEALSFPSPGWMLHSALSATNNLFPWPDDLLLIPLSPSAFSLSLRKPAFACPLQGQGKGNPATTGNCRRHQSAGWAPFTVLMPGLRQSLPVAKPGLPGYGTITGSLHLELGSGRARGALLG